MNMTNVQQRAPLTTDDVTTLETVRFALGGEDVPDTLAGLATVVPVTTTTVDVVSFDETGNNADAVAEGALKPEAGVTGTSAVTVPLELVAHWGQLTRQAYDDSGISDAYRAKLSRQVKAKMNAAELAVVGAGTYTASSGADHVSALMQAIADLVDLGYAANGVLATPAVAGELAKANIALPVIPTNSVTAPLVGDFKSGVELYRRQEVQVHVSQSHASTFTVNVLTLLAEGRHKTAVVDSAAIRQLATA